MKAMVTSNNQDRLVLNEIFEWKIKIKIQGFATQHRCVIVCDMELTRYLRRKRHVTLSEVKNAADFSQFSSLSSLSAFLYPFQYSNGSGSSNRLHKGCRPGFVPVSHDHESSHTRQKLPGPGPETGSSAGAENFLSSGSSLRL